MVPVKKVQYEKGAGPEEQIEPPVEQHEINVGQGILPAIGLARIMIRVMPMPVIA